MRIDVKQDVYSASDRTGAVEQVNCIAHFGAQLDSALRSRFRDLIAERIYYNARMVVIIFNHCSENGFVIGEKITRIVMVFFRYIPSVKCLVHDIHAYSVAGIEK